VCVPKLYTPFVKNQLINHNESYPQSWYDALGFQEYCRLFSPSLKSAAYVCLLWVCMAAFPFSPVMAGQGCGLLKEALGQSFNDHYAFTATAISDRGLSIILFTRRDGNWHIIGVDENLQACIVARGTDWVWAMGQDI